MSLEEQREKILKDAIACKDIDNELYLHTKNASSQMMW